MSHRFFLVALMSLAVNGASRADTRVAFYARSSGYQDVGYESQGEVSTQGLKSRREEIAAPQSMTARLPARKENSFVITRLDLDKVWTFDEKAKTYAENSVQESVSSDAKTTKKKKKQKTPPKKPTHEMKQIQAWLKDTGEKKELNGFSTERVSLKGLIEAHEFASNLTTVYLFDANIWRADLDKTLKPALEEQKNYAKEFRKKAGVEAASGFSTVFEAASIRRMMGVDERQTAEVIDAIKKKFASIGGFPIAIEVVWTLRADTKVLKDGIEVSGPILANYYEIKQVSTNPLLPAEFEVPAGYKPAK